MDSAVGGLRQIIMRRKQALLSDRSSWDAHWREISDYMLPRRSRFNLSQHNQGKKRHQLIVNDMATRSIRTMAAGMSSGITSPARPWFKTTVADEELADRDDVRLWLQQVDSTIRAVFNSGNLYRSLPMEYEQLGTFGTSCVFQAPHPRWFTAFYPMVVGQYSLGAGGDMTIDTCYREVQMSVGQLVELFGKDRLSRAARALYSRGNVDATIECLHAVEPHDDRLDVPGIPPQSAWRSVYLEGSADHDDVLGVGGYEQRPVYGSRWVTTGEDVYGSSCPGMQALGDVKQLQLMEKSKIEAIQKMTRPPLQAPAHGIDGRISHLSGDVTYVNSSELGAQIRPMYEPTLRLDYVRAEIAAVEQRVWACFYGDLFLMLQQERGGPERTATEINLRHEEKLLQLGPVLQSVHSDRLDPMMDRTFQMLWNAGRIPPPPRELEGLPMSIEYISILAQALRAAGLGAIERVAQAALSIAAVEPSVLDRVDFDEIISEIARATGAPADVLRSMDEVEQIRAGRAEAQRAAVEAERAAQAATAVKDVSQTDASNPLIQAAAANA